jgi:hypothetical protein
MFLFLVNGFRFLEPGSCFWALAPENESHSPETRTWHQRPVSRNQKLEARHIEAFDRKPGAEKPAQKQTQHKPEPGKPKN